MTNKPPYQVLLPLVASLLLSTALAAPAADVCPAGDCLLPDVEYQICTPTPSPPNPKKGTAGLQGGSSSLEVLRAGAGWYQWNPDPDVILGFPAHAQLRDKYQTALVVSGTLQLGGTGEWVWGVNEPSLPSPAGSLLTVDQVILMEGLKFALAPDRLNGSPAYTQESLNTLASVYTGFETRYGYPPPWDAINIHCYWQGDDESPCVATLAQAKQFAIHHDIPWVIVSEFGTCAPYLDSASRYIDALNADPMVLMYFWYPFSLPNCDTSLFTCGTSGCSLTSLGQMYQSK